jgi:multicomponent Na+:H+ antiporter subunit G
MNSVLELLAIIAVLIGTAFSIIGVVGNFRLPDVYTRLHALGKVSTFGAVLLLLAAGFATPSGLAKVLAVIAFLIVAGPVVSHALASAALRVGIKMVNPVRDDRG